MALAQAAQSASVDDVNHAVKHAAIMSRAFGRLLSGERGSVVRNPATILVIFLVL